MKCVYTSAGMVHWGQLAAKCLNRPFYTEGPIGDMDEALIVGMYDAPYYLCTLDYTKKARKRHIHWCGTDVEFLTSPDHLPEAVHTVETPWLREELLRKGVDATVATLPSNVHVDVCPLPDKPVVSSYLGTNPDKYGAGMLSALMEVFPEVDWITYQFGQVGDVAAVADVIRRSTVHIRLTTHDGSCVSSREYMEAGRYAITTVPLPHAKQVDPEDLSGIVSALAPLLKKTEPNVEAAAYYKDFNSPEHFLRSMKEVGCE